MNKEPFLILKRDVAIRKRKYEKKKELSHLSNIHVELLLSSKKGDKKFIEEENLSTHLGFRRGICIILQL